VTVGRGELDLRRFLRREAGLRERGLGLVLAVLELEVGEKAGLPGVATTDRGVAAPP